MVVLTYGEDSNYTLLASKEIRLENELILLISWTDRGASKSGAVCREHNDEPYLKGGFSAPSAGDASVPTDDIRECENRCYRRCQQQMSLS